MLSRAADALYWLNRYLERADNYARFLDVNLESALETRAQAEQWMPLIETTGDMARFTMEYGNVATADNVPHFLIADEKNPNSILSCVRAARENARSVRELISSEMWLHLNRFYLTLNEQVQAGQQIQHNAEFLSWVKENCALHQGIMDNSMSHTEAWHFGSLGRYLERADKTSRLLDIKYFYLLPSPDAVGTELDLFQWQGVLRSASALEMFRRTHPKITPSFVADFLILNPYFPRSIRYSLQTAETSMRSLTLYGQSSYRNEAEKLMGAFRSELQYTSAKDIFDRGLHEYLDTIETRVNEIDKAVQEVFLAPRDASASLISAAMLDTSAQDQQ